MKTIIVVPTAPNSGRISKFIEAWEEILTGHKLIITEDSDERILDFDDKYPFDIEIYSHREMKDDLGDNSWIFPHKNAAHRSYGFYKAWQENPDMIVTLDDDTKPVSNNFLEEHYSILSQTTTLDWVSTCNKVYPRGFPYEIRNNSPIVLNHGLWLKYPDLDGITSLIAPNYTFQEAQESKVIPRYNFAPLCGMNVAFKPELAPAMYFGLQGPDYKFDRFDDIWAGIFMKKVCDHLGLAVHSGKPLVLHDNKPDPFSDIRKEANGLEPNEILWKKVRDINLYSDFIIDTYEELADKLEMEGKYWNKLKEAMIIWIKLFR